MTDFSGFIANTSVQLHTRRWSFTKTHPKDVRTNINNKPSQTNMFCFKMWSFFNLRFVRIKRKAECLKCVFSKTNLLFKSCLILFSPMECSTLGFSVLHYPEFAQTHISLSHPLSPPHLPLTSIFPIIRIFSHELALCIKWPEYWSFSFNISPTSSNWRLIRILTVPWIFKENRFIISLKQGWKSVLIKITKTETFISNGSF